MAKFRNCGHSKVQKNIIERKATNKKSKAESGRGSC